MYPSASADPCCVDPLEIPAPARGNGKADFGAERWELPPLILHPFSDQSGPGKLLESSRASLMLHGVLPNEHLAEDELTRRLLEGRLCEIRMLYFVGKDLLRWIEQSMGFISRVDRLAGMGIKEQSFAGLLVEFPPRGVEAKLLHWGVRDFRAIFSRALGLNLIFRQPPSLAVITDRFMHHYYRYADHLYACGQSLDPYTVIGAENFHFELYASGEYSRLLEQEWGTP